MEKNECDLFQFLTAEDAKKARRTQRYVRISSVIDAVGNIPGFPVLKLRKVTLKENCDVGM